MGGGLLQLVAYGAQDVYLTGNPQITFFKVVYRRHTNFSMESIQQTFNGDAKLGNRVTAQISRNGDLLHKLYLKVGFTTDTSATGPIQEVEFTWDAGVTLTENKNHTFTLTGIGGEDAQIEIDYVHSSRTTTVEYTNRGTGYSNGQTYTADANGIKGTIKVTKLDTPETYLQPFYGYRMLKNVELEIGGQRIDRQYGEWMYVWNELTMPEGKKAGFYQMVGGQMYNAPIQYKADTKVDLYIPLEFWFCRNIGLALPLIALQYHEVKLNIEFNTFDDIKAENTGDKYATSVTGAVGADTIPANGNATKFKDGSLSMELWADYVFLDTDERRRFAQMSHEYLIEQVQFTGTETVEATNKSYRLSFNHPVKELIWAIQPKGDKYNWNNFGFKNGAANNNMSERSNCVKSAKLMLNGNDRFAQRDGEYFSLIQPYQHHTNIPTVNPGINVYSFALKPEEHQCSGTLNHSRIDVAALQVESKTAGNMFVFAHNYNVLRILSGMGGLAYSN